MPSVTGVTVNATVQSIDSAITHAINTLTADASASSPGGMAQAELAAHLEVDQGNGWERVSHAAMQVTIDKALGSGQLSISRPITLPASAKLRVRARLVSGSDVEVPAQGALVSVRRLGKYTPIAAEPVDEGESTPPSLPATDTTWSKALTFIGDPRSAEYAHIKWNGASTSPVRMGGNASIVAGNTDDTKTASHWTARPWAVGCVFLVDSSSGDHVIWTQGEGVSSTSDNIILEIDSSNVLKFKWGREGTGYNTYEFGTLSTGTWYGVYVESDGTRLNATDATASNLADAIRLRYVNLSTAAVTDPGGSWTSTGISMGEAVAGSYYIGGLGTNDSLDGKVASSVVTTLSLDTTLPTDAEIAMIIRDPEKWLDDYKVGNPYRRPNYQFDTTGFTLDGSGHSGSATQVWLMGDGTNDAYSTIRNQVSVNDTNTTALNMVNMESSDITTVTITGLS